MPVSTSTDLRTVFHDLTGLDLQKDFNEFSTRLAFQKLMYLLQSAGAVNPKRSFGFHVYGPYSPDWAKEGFAARDGKAVPLSLTSAYAKVAPVLTNRSVTDLVALATLHYYHRVLKLPRDRARQRAISDGKWGLVGNFDTAWKELDSRHWLS